MIMPNYAAGRSTSIGPWLDFPWRQCRTRGHFTLANPDMFFHTLAFFSGRQHSVWMMSIIHPVSKEEKFKNSWFVSFGGRELENRRPGGPLWR